MSQKNIKALLFDLGDTIFNYGHVNKTRAIIEAASISHKYLLGLNQPAGSFIGYLLSNLIAIRTKYFISHFTKEDFDSLELMKYLGEKHGFNLTENQYEELNWLWYKPLCDLAIIEEDIVETFTKLQSFGLKLGIISNTFVHGSSLDRHLKSIGLLDFFKVRLYSCDFAYRKPDPRIFLNAAELIGEEPENIIFVGDRLDTDVKGSLASGMMSVLKKSYANKRKKAPTGVFRIETISQLPDLVEKLGL